MDVFISEISSLNPLILLRQPYVQCEAVWSRKHQSENNSFCYSGFIELKSLWKRLHNSSRPPSIPNTMHVLICFPLCLAITSDLYFPYIVCYMLHNKISAVYLYVTCSHVLWQIYLIKHEFIVYIPSGLGLHQEESLWFTANWTGHILRRNFLLHDATEGQMTEVKGVTRRRRRRRTQLLDDWELKEEAEDRKMETTVYQLNISIFKLWWNFSFRITFW